MTIRSTHPIHLLAVVAAAALLTGCGLLDIPTTPDRDDSGAIVEGDENSDVFELAVGDCTNDGDQETGELTTVETVPCTEPHDNEAYHAEDLPDGDFPGDEASQTTADEICYSNFTAFVGLSYEESRLSYFPFSPTAESWAMGDREVLCMVYDADGAPLEGSVAGIAE